MFYMESEIAQVVSNDNPIGPQPAKILRQHLLGRPGNEPNELPEADRTRSQGA